MRASRLHAADTDWDIFRETMDEKLKLIADLESMETEIMYSTFIAIIGEAISIATAPDAWTGVNVGEVRFKYLLRVLGGQMHVVGEFSFVRRLWLSLNSQVRRKTL